MIRRLALVLALCLAAVPVWAGDAPQGVIGRFYGSLLATMKSGNQMGFRGRFDTLTPVIDGSFDMPEMTRGTLGSSVRTITPDQMARVVEAFRRFTIASYAANFNEFNGERFEVGETRVTSPGQAVVPTRLVPGDKTEPVELDYVMHEDQGHWTVTDVLMQGSVSQMAMRRSEFVSVLRRDGIDGLVETINKKTAALAVKG